MKKLFVLLLATLFLTACGSAEEQAAPVKETKETPVPVEKSKQAIENEGLTQEQLNEKIKAEAVQADFIELNVDNPPIGKRVFIDGEVSVLTKGIMDEFTITAKEGNGYGMYKVELRNTTDAEYEEGDQVRVYGAVNGKDESGMPKVSSSVLEKQE